MANIAIPNLPPVIALSGNELIEVVQSGTSSRATIGMIVMALAQYITNNGIAILVQPTYAQSISWAPPTTSFDARPYGNVVITVLTAPSTAYSIQWSPDGTTWETVSAVDGNYNVQANIATTFTGKLTLAGTGYIRLNGGTGGTFEIGASQ